MYNSVEIDHEVDQFLYILGVAKGLSGRVQPENRIYSELFNEKNLLWTSDNQSGRTTEKTKEEGKTSQNTKRRKMLPLSGAGGETKAGGSATGFDHLAEAAAPW